MITMIEVADATGHRTGYPGQDCELRGNPALTETLTARVHYFACRIERVGRAHPRRNEHGVRSRRARVERG